MQIIFQILFNIITYKMLVCIFTQKCIFKKLFHKNPPSRCWKAPIWPVLDILTCIWQRRVRVRNSVQGREDRPRSIRFRRKSNRIGFKHYDYILYIQCSSFKLAGGFWALGASHRLPLGLNESARITLSKTILCAIIVC